MNLEYKCILKLVFGIDCAGCGGTRMILSLFKLEFYQAFRYNPLMFILGLFILGYIVFNLILKICKKNIYFPSKKVLYSLVIIILLFTVFRNIPGFEFLLPTDV